MIKEAIDVLKEEFKNNEDLAWSWHCNLAMAIVDSGGDHIQANIAAARFMMSAFEVNTYILIDVKTSITKDDLLRASSLIK